MNKYLVTCCFLLLGISAFTQTDTLPAYKKWPYLPAFNIQMADSSWFTKTNLANKPTLIMYFNPDCGHCQLETEDIIGNMNKLKNLQIIMITSRGVPEMKQFSDQYLLKKFKNITIGSDTKRYISHFYEVKFTPFSALYDKDGKLVQVYESGIDFEALDNYLNAGQPG